MLKKYIISDEGKDFVLRSVGILWRRQECFVKKKHFKAYINNNDRLTNAPDSIPEAHVKDLTEYWNLDGIEVSLFYSQYKIFKYVLSILIYRANNLMRQFTFYFVNNI